MVNSPLLPRGRSWSIRILQLAFGFFCTVVVNTYTASLASLLTVQNLSKPISSLLDLLRAYLPFHCLYTPWQHVKQASWLSQASVLSACILADHHHHALHMLSMPAYHHPQ